MTIEMYEEVMKYLQIDQCRKLIIEQNQKIADLEDKLANADYQLEGRDNEIRELQHKVDTMQGFLDHDIEYDMDKTIQEQKIKIEELKFQIEKMKQDLDNARENANKQEQWEIYSVLNDIYNDNFVVITVISN